MIAIDEIWAERLHNLNKIRYNWLSWTPAIPY